MTVSRNIAVSVSSRTRSAGSNPVSARTASISSTMSGRWSWSGETLTLSMSRSGPPAARRATTRPAGLGQDPAAERQDRPVLLGQADELVRVGQAADRMAPADERLHADRLAAVECHDRLVVDDQLLAGDAAGELGRQLVAGDDRGVHRRVEDGEPALAGGLGRVHRHVGVAQDVVGALEQARRTSPRAIAMPTLDPDDGLAAGHREGHPEQVDQPLRHGDRVAQVRLVDDQDRELVATEPRGQVALADRAPDPLCDGNQKLVAGGVAERVVDHLEVVEVEEQDDRDAGLHAVAQVERHLLGEQGPVRQVRQRVVIGLVAELLLEPAELRERLLELAVLECDRDLVGERLEQAQVVVAEARALGQAVDHGQRPDRRRLADERRHHRLADGHPTPARRSPRHREEGVPLRRGPGSDEVRGG